MPPLLSTPPPPYITKEKTKEKKRRNLKKNDWGGKRKLIKKTDTGGGGGVAPSPATQRRVPLHHTKQLPSTNITRKQCPPAIVFPTVFSYKRFPASEM